MILAAGLLVLLGLGLFVAGILTGATALYWGCVAACAVAAVLLMIARRRISATGPAGTPAAAAGSPAAPAGGAAPAAGGAADAGRAAEGAGAATAAPAVRPAPDGPAEDLPDPDVEEVEVTDLLLVVDLKDEVLVLDERPRYHIEGCRHLKGRTPIPLPVDEARSDGFTPCAVCEPDRNLAERARARKAARGS